MREAAGALASVTRSQAVRIDTLPADDKERRPFAPGLRHAPVGSSRVNYTTNTVNANGEFNAAIWPFSTVAVGRRSRQLSGVKQTIDRVCRDPKPPS